MHLGAEIGAVGQAEFAILPQGLLDRWQARHRLFRLEPPARVEVDALAGAFLLAAPAGRQGCREFEQGGFQLLGHTQLVERGQGC